MAAAIFALLGAMLGVVGTLATERSRARAEDSRSRREALRLTCADFTSAIARMRSLAMDLMRNPADSDLLTFMRAADLDARVNYERLRLTSTSREVQEAGRRTLRYTWGLVREVQGKPPREDEVERGPLMLSHESLLELYAAVRRELGVPRANDVYREPDEWLVPTPGDRRGNASGGQTSTD
jgi:hypothetical protein